MNRNIRYRIAVLLSLSAMLQASDTTDLASELAALNARVEALETSVAPSESPRDRLAMVARRLDTTLRPVIEMKPGGHLVIQTADGEVTTTIGGRVHVQALAGSADGDLRDQVGDVEDGVQFRRARLDIRTRYGKDVESRLRFDFNTGVASVLNATVTFRDLVPGISKLVVGREKEPTGFENQMSSNDRLFVEQGIGHALGTGRATGVLAKNTWGENKQGTWAVGLFRPTDAFGDGDGDGESAVSGRATALVVGDGSDAPLVHVGASHSRRRPTDDMVRFRSRPEVGQGARFVDTGNLAAKAVDITGIEFAARHGAWTTIAEWYGADVSGADGAEDADFEGWMLSLAWMLTGEIRPYSNSKGTFGRIVPASPRNRHGPGAWELAMRRSHVDLDDGAIDGGQLDDWTIGLNWHLDLRTKLMLNVIDAEVDGVGDATLTTMRLQHVF